MRVRRVLRRTALWVAYALSLLVILELSMRLAGAAFLRTRVPPPDADRGEGPSFDIMAIGESTTFGLGVAPRDAYPLQLERLLSERSRVPVRVFNVGVPGQTSTSILRSIDAQLLGLRPDLVISQFGVNDFNESLNDLNSRILFGRIYVPEWVTRLRTYKLVSVIKDYLLHSPRIGEDGVWTFFDRTQRGPDGEKIENPFYYEQLARNYGEIVDRIRSRGSAVIILSYLSHNKMDLLEGLFQELSRRPGVYYVDVRLAPDERADSLFGADGWHPSAAGHRKMAEALAEAIEAEELLPGPTDR